MAKYPPINDITTTTDNPPKFFAAPAASRQFKQSTASVIETYYSDLAPVELALDSAEAIQKIQEILSQLNMQNIVVSADGKAVQAVDITRFIRFRDDIVCEVRPGKDGASFVHIRSASRLGLADFGTNAKRIRRVITALQAA